MGRRWRSGCVDEEGRVAVRTDVRAGNVEAENSEASATRRFSHPLRYGQDGVTEDTGRIWRCADKTEITSVCMPSGHAVRIGISFQSLSPSVPEGAFLLLLRLVLCNSHPPIYDTSSKNAIPQRNRQSLHYMHNNDSYILSTRCRGPTQQRQRPSKQTSNEMAQTAQTATSKEDPRRRGWPRTPEQKFIQ